MEKSMNIESLLNYQELDRKLHAIEQKLTNSPYKKKANELTSTVKKAQNRATELEAEAQKLIADIEDIKKNYETNKTRMDKMLKENVEEFGIDDIEKNNALKTKISSNLGILEKMLQKIAENVNKILAEFNKVKKINDEARAQYQACKQKIEQEIQTVEPEKNELIKKLSVLEKSVEPDLMASYKKKRSDNIFPVLVELRGENFCGGCSMELPKVAISRIKENGVITCEHCKRFVYKK